MTLEVQSNDFIALADIALHNDDLQHAIGEGTRTAYYRRLDTMFAQGDEHGEFMRQQAAEAKRRALRELPDLLEKPSAISKRTATRWNGRKMRRKPINWCSTSRAGTRRIRLPKAKAC